MSVYLYGFKSKGNATPTDGGHVIEIFNLTFRMGSLGRTREDDRRAERISNAMDRAWEGKQLPGFFVIGKREDGDEVYRATETIYHPEWVDTEPLPGNAQRIGVLKKIGGRFRVILDARLGS